MGRWTSYPMAAGAGCTTVAAGFALLVAPLGPLWAGLGILCAGLSLVVTATVRDAWQRRVAARPERTRGHDGRAGLTPRPAPPAGPSRTQKPRAPGVRRVRAAKRSHAATSRPGPRG